MDIAVIEVPRQKAWEEVRAYRKAIKERHNAEDQLILRGYREVLKGRRLISLNKTIQLGGFNEDHTPKLAVAQADAKFVRCRYEWTEGAYRLVFWWTNHGWSAIRDVSYLTALGLRLRQFTLDKPITTYQAIVPLVPPALRPPFALSGYHILFEAEWKRVAPKDPALLKHISGDLWALLTTWDLTELERAVLAERR